ncbi:MAG: AAA family ATPase [Actinobacteria bacterium]|nr:AAA family ATPase [Actinomycetota bacterium]
MTPSPEPCRRCSEPLPQNARFCPGCGAPVVAEARERKLVTVIFVDIAASTELASRLDPERFREVLSAFYQLVSGEISALRGRTERYVGDAVMGAFGVPTAHDDDAVRAIRAGLAIVDLSEKLGAELGLPMPMRVRVGVNTGPVAVSADDEPGLVSGAEVNMAARLQQGAGTGEVLVGATTRQLAHEHVEFGEQRMISAKGFDGQVPAWPAIRISPGVARQTIPLVDRRRELALLSDAFARAVERERVHLVTLLGEPGIGKSRVVEEFLAQLPEGVKVLSGRSSAFEEQATFWPIAQMVLREIGEERSAPADRLSARLVAAVSEWVPPGEVEQAARRLGFTLGIGEEGREDDRYHAGEVRAGLLSLLAGITSLGPVVLVFEDLQESDPLLLDLVEQLVKAARKMPLLVVCVARWEFLQDRPGWAGGIADAVTLWVEPLARGDAVQLAVESGDLDEAEAARVAEHAGGNPFFIVEITGMLRHDGAPAGVTPPLPPTVQAVIAARIDELTPAARELLRRASIFARGDFDVSELELIAEPAGELLEELEGEEFLVRDAEQPEVWRFRSDVLRHVAYESLAKRERQRLHLRLANRLAEPETADRYPRSIAYHLERAARSALDLNPLDRALAERAEEALARAGDLARRRVESRAAADLYERALALAGPEPGWGDREAAILASLGEARYWLGEFEGAEAALARALATPGGESVAVRAHAGRFLADITLTVRGDPDRAAELFDGAVEAAREMGGPRVLSRTLLMAAWVPYWRGDMAAARALFEEALEVARSAGGRDAWAEVRALVGLGSVTSPEGNEQDVRALAEEALAIAEASGQAFTTAVAQESLGASLRRMMRLDESVEHASAAIRTFRELDARWELASALGDRGSAQRAAGRLEEGERDLREAYRLCNELHERSLIVWTTAELARLLMAKRDMAGARQVLGEPAVRVPSGEPSATHSLLIAESALALADGDEALARERAVAAIESERRQHGAGNALASLIWWAGRLFGDEVGGEPGAGTCHLGPSPVRIGVPWPIEGPSPCPRASPRPSWLSRSWLPSCPGPWPGRAPLPPSSRCSMRRRE